jgi:hypothetical protein
MSVVRRLASQVAAGRAVDFRPSLTWRGTALSSALFALALAAGDAPSQSGGCARCASVPVAGGRSAAENRGAAANEARGAAVRSPLRTPETGRVRRELRRLRARL